MTDENQNGPSRRAFLTGAGAAAAGTLAGGASAQADPAIAIHPWMQELGDGVDAAPYGMPAQPPGTLPAGGNMPQAPFLGHEVMTAMFCWRLEFDS